MSDKLPPKPPRSQIVAFPGTTPEHLKGGGGDGTFDGMEARIAKLETDVTDIRVTLARIEAKLDSKIDYKWLTIYVLGIVAVVLRNEIAAFFTGSAAP